MPRFELWHWVESGGDGSANARFAISEENATKKDEAQSERWGESSVGSNVLEYDDGKLFLIRSQYDSKQKKHIEIRIELKAVT